MQVLVDNSIPCTIFGVAQGPPDSAALRVEQRSKLLVVRCLFAVKSNWPFIDTAALYLPTIG